MNMNSYGLLFFSRILFSNLSCQVYTKIIYKHFAVVGEDVNA